MEALKRHADLTVQTTQGNRIIPKEQQVRLAKRPNGALHTTAQGNALGTLPNITHGVPKERRIFLPHILNDRPVANQS